MSFKSCTGDKTKEINAQRSQVDQALQWFFSKKNVVEILSIFKIVDKIFVVVKIIIMCLEDNCIFQFPFVVYEGK